jgi:hypothetical protein
MQPARSARESAKEQAKARMLRELERQQKAAEAHGETRLSRILNHAALELLDNSNPYFFKTIAHLRQVPVTFGEFLESPEFLGEQVSVWPKLRRDLERMNPDILSGEPQVNEYLDGGGTGTGKSFKATVTQAYQLYWLTCLNRPQKLYGLREVDPIVFMFNSVSERITRRVLYEPFRQMFLSMPYARRWVQYDKYRERELSLEGNIRVLPALAAVQAMVGQAILSGILDEVNFMNVVENSQAAAGARGLGGRFDQAELAHTTITRRRKSRFTFRGPVPGCISVLSSIRYKGDFLDRRIEQAEENGETEPGNGVLVFRRRQYEVQPEEKYSGEKFRVLVGTDHWPTRILEDHEQEGDDFPHGAQVEDVPIEYYYEFRNDPEGALRDVIGVSTDAITPFITQRHKVIEAVLRGTEKYDLKPWVDHQVVDLTTQGMPQIIEENLPSDRDTPRYVHVDLSKSQDRCGIAISRVDGYVSVLSPTGVAEHLPMVVVELAVGLTPNQQDHVDFAEVRKWITQLVAFYGFNIVKVTYDGFQSTESIQLWRKQGIRSDTLSTERSLEPYTYLRDCFYQDRIAMVDNEVGRLEIVNLEYDERRGKVDHAPRFSNDIADAICGSVYSAANSRLARRDAVTTTSEGQKVRVGRAGKRRPGSRRVQQDHEKTS